MNSMFPEQPGRPILGRLALAALVFTSCVGVEQDSSSRQMARVVATWSQDPRGSWSLINGLPTQRQRLMALEALVLAHGSEMNVETTCPLLSSEPCRQRCRELLSRAHLWTGGQDQAPSAPEKDIPAPSGCHDDETPATCATRQATEAALAGVEQPTTACAGIDDPRLAGECGFLVAENLARKGDASIYPRAVEACMQAGPFRRNCLDHVSVELWRSILDEAGPSPALVLPRELLAARELDSTLSRYWKDRDLPLGQALSSKLWSVADAEAILSSGLLDSTPTPNHGQGQVLTPLRADPSRVRVVVYQLDNLAVTASPTPEEKHSLAARLGELSRAIIFTRADILCLHGVLDAPSLAYLASAIVALGGTAYPWLGTDGDHERFTWAVMSRVPVLSSLAHHMPGSSRCLESDGSAQAATAGSLFQVDLNLDADENKDITLFMAHRHADTWEGGASAACPSPFSNRESTMACRSILEGFSRESPDSPLLFMADTGMADCVPSHVPLLEQRILASTNALPGGTASWQVTTGSARLLSPQFLLDEHGKPRSWNPAAAQGFSSRLPFMVEFRHPGGSP